MPPAGAVSGYEGFAAARRAAMRDTCNPPPPPTPPAWYRSAEGAPPRSGPQPPFMGIPVKAIRTL